ncbi:hypothetical protein BE21_09505 [Sorangium cellulosum]|uniref:Uncharacterized protein n=1 Tax=Sorangium cellulosum TaxID=56 RepID=A0A150U237_SORCE|nr:hypothetical protein BE21_09505 [Sorangium cellulosum]
MNQAATTRAARLDELLQHIASLPKEQRTIASMEDEFIDLAARLPGDTLEFPRLKAALRFHGVRVADWVQAVKGRRDQFAPKPVEGPALAVIEDKRPKIIINQLEEHEVNDAAIAAIAKRPNVYQRLGHLVRILDTKRKQPGMEVEEIVPEIREYEEPSLRDLFSRAARWYEERLRSNSGTSELVRAHPPEWSVRAVRCWRAWPHVKPLYHLSEIPVLMPDGTILSTPGYDEKSGIFYRSRVTVPPVPEAPTEAEVRVAVQKLLDLVNEMSFEKDVHRSAWLAAALTPIARWAFKGQTPLFMFDANQPGSGKGLMTRVIGLLVLGHHMDLITATTNEEEERKRITAKILSGATMVVIDNIGTTFGSPTLEALLTTGVWSERLLGSNDAPRLDAWITWYGSGNNVQYARSDTRRRVCSIRILTNMERPEERTGFKYENLEQHIEEHRGELLAAAFTLLRAWIRTGKKASELPGWGGPWGSFDGWDQVVRGAIVYAGLEDPIAAKATKESQGTEESGLKDLTLGLEEAVAQLGRNGAVSSSQIIDAMTENDELRRLYKDTPVRFRKLRDAFSKLLPKIPQGRLPSQGQLGSLFGRHRHVPVVGKRITSRTVEGDNVWFVEPVPAKEDKDIEREAIVAEGSAAQSVMDFDGTCTVCGSTAHNLCGLCSKCPPERNGCPCRSCISAHGSGYIQRGACNLCGSRECRCSRCGNCFNITPMDGGCCC